jgi:hypothetical protein
MNLRDLIDETASFAISKIAYCVIIALYNHLNGNQSAWRIFNNHLCIYTNHHYQ